MVQSCGSLIIFIYNSLINSISSASTPSSTSTGVTSLSILNSLKKWRSPTSSDAIEVPSMLGRIQLNDKESSQPLSGKLSTGHNDREVPKKHFKNCMNKSLGTCHIAHYRWPTKTENYDTWHFTANYVVCSFENISRATLKNTKQRRRNCNSRPSSPDQTFSCSHCNHARDTTELLASGVLRRIKLFQ